MPVGAKWSWSRYSSLTTVRIRSCPVATAHCLVSSCELSLLERHDCLAQVSSESSRHHTRHDAKTSRLRPISQFAVHESRVYVDSTSSANHRKTHALDDLNYSMLVPGCHRDIIRCVLVTNRSHYRDLLIYSYWLCSRISVPHQHDPTNTTSNM
jgi:hypothetical protein